MRKLIGILALVMILCLAIAIPGLAVKIAPYSQPLHDIIHWDARSAKLIIMNPEGESLTVSWPATVDLWNYDGKYWAYNLPDGDKFSFKKEVMFGYENNVITYTEGEPIVEIWGTCAGTSGSVNAMPLYVMSILTGEGQVGRAAEFVLAPTARMGSWGNAVKALLDVSATDGSIGLLAGLCAEVVTPATALSGTLACVEHEIVATEGLTLGAHIGSANTLNFMQFALSGHGAAVTQVDTYGQFFILNGVTNAAGNMLSLHYLTLKLGINELAKYLVLSHKEDGYSAGTSGSPVVFSADGDMNLEVYSTFTGDEAFFRGMYVRSDYTPGTSGEASVYGIRGHAYLTDAQTHDAGALTDESFVGIHGYATSHSGGTFNAAGLTVAGLKGEVGGTGTYDAVKVVCGVWAKPALMSSVSAGHYTGVYVYASHGAYPADSMMYSWGYFDSGIDLSGWIGGTDGPAFSFSSYGTDEQGTHETTVDGHILINVNGDDRFIRLWDDS